MPIINRGTKFNKFVTADNLLFFRFTETCAFEENIIIKAKFLERYIIWVKFRKDAFIVQEFLYTTIRSSLRRVLLVSYIPSLIIFLLCLFYFFLLSLESNINIGWFNSILLRIKFDCKSFKYLYSICLQILYFSETIILTEIWIDLLELI